MPHYAGSDQFWTPVEAEHNVDHAFGRRRNVLARTSADAGHLQ